MGLTPFQIHLDHQKLSPGGRGMPDTMFASSDLDAYPVLTEEVGYAPSPLAKSGEEHHPGRAVPPRTDWPSRPSPTCSAGSPAGTT